MRAHTFVAILVGATVCIGSTCLAANPYDASMPVRYRDTENGMTYSTNRPFPDSAYLVADTGWCAEDHRTATGRKYDHTHTANGFPFFDESRHPDAIVTESDANYAYDADYPGFTRSGSPTSEYNCHGHAIEQASAPAILSRIDGVGRWRPDLGYASTSEPAAGSIWSTTTHSRKIEEVYMGCDPDDYLVKKLSEKHDASAIYTITYDSPGEDYTSNLYKK